MTMRNIYFDISTFQNLRNRPDEIISDINDVLQYAFVNYKTNLVIHFEVIDTNYTQSYKYNKSNWHKIENLIKEQKLQTFGLMLIINKYLMSFYIFFDINYYMKRFEYYTPITNCINFSITEEFYKSTECNININFFIKTFKKYFTKYNGVNGYISLETRQSALTTNPSTLEQVLELDYKRHSQYFNYFARGYFWGNFLSKEHIKNLGGIKNINNILFDTFEIIELIKNELVYIQLTKDIFNYSDQKLLNLKSFFKPILPEDTEKAKNIFLEYNKKSPGWCRLFFN
jgi:hypothetical protein